MKLWLWGFYTYTECSPLLFLFFPLLPLSRHRTSSLDSPPSLSQLSTTNSALNEMQDAIHQVRQAHAASLSRLDTGPNSAAQRETDELIDSTRRLTAANKTRIQKLNKLAKDKAQKQQVQAAKSRFMGLLQDYQTVEKEFRKKVRERGERQYKIVKPDATAEEVDQVLETENPQIFSQALLSSNRYGDARGALREIQERNQDIKKIEKTLTELAQMFNEVGPHRFFFSLFFFIPFPHVLSFFFLLGTCPPDPNAKNR